MLLLLAALVSAGAGVLFLSNATSGVGLICVGCLFGVWARILQAGVHHREVIEALESGVSRQ